MRILNQDFQKLFHKYNKLWFWLNLVGRLWSLHKFLQKFSCIKLSAYEVSEAFIDNCNTIKEEMMIFKTYADEREKRHSKEIRQSGL